MIRVAWVRGAYLNNFEGQNYQFGNDNIHLTGISSLYPLDLSVSFPVIRLPSPADIPALPILRYFSVARSATKYICNRLMGDSQLLVGLEKLAPSFDIFHTADPHYYYSYQLARLRAKNIIKHLIVTSWETIPFNNESVSKKRLIKRFVISQADQFICYTERAAQALNKEGVSMKKIKIVQLGVDIRAFHPPQQKRTELKTILFVGRLVEEKGVLDLYKAFLGMRTDVKLRIVGNGPLKTLLQKTIAVDGVEDRVTIEERPYRDMPDVFRSADLFVLPSRTTSTWEEQYGMVLGEAMASGLPVITTATGAITEVTGEAAVTVASGDPQALRRAMRRLSVDRQEYEERVALSLHQAREHLDSHKTAKIIGTIYSDIYEKISDNRGSSHS